VTGEVLPADLLERMHGYWRASNYLSVGQIYLQDNPLLDTPLLLEHVKPRLLGHWGTTPGLNFIYVHLNRLIREHDLEHDVCHRPGTWRPGSRRPQLSRRQLLGALSAIDHAGPRWHCRSCSGSFPGRTASRATSRPRRRARSTKAANSATRSPMRIGAAFDNPGLIVACVIGDGEAETGALATSWHSNKFLNPARDGAVLPILHLNGYKIANPTVLARIAANRTHRADARLWL
jgi:xylulose-5-phosphate/fructose-6-phosphate phosphoketolase